MDITNLLLFSTEIADPLNMWRELADQGVNILLLALAVWWMNGKNKALEKKLEDQQKKIEDLHKEMLEYERRDNTELLKIIQENTSAFKGLSEVVDKIVLLINN